MMQQEAEQLSQAAQQTEQVNLLRNISLTIQRSLGVHSSACIMYSPAGIPARLLFPFQEHFWACKKPFALKQEAQYWVTHSWDVHQMLLVVQLCLDPQVPFLLVALSCKCLRHAVHHWHQKGQRCSSHAQELCAQANSICRASCVWRKHPLLSGLSPPAGAQSHEGVVLDKWMQDLPFQLCFHAMFISPRGAS